MKLFMAMVVVLTSSVLAQGQSAEPGGTENQKKVMVIKAEKLPPAMAKLVLASLKNVDESAGELIGIGGKCHVDSRFDGKIKVYINGRYRGTIPPYGDIFPFVGDDPDEVTDLYAVSECGRYSWRIRVRGDFDNYHWILRGN